MTYTKDKSIVPGDQRFLSPYLYHPTINIVVALGFATSSANKEIIAYTGILLGSETFVDMQTHFLMIIQHWVIEHS